MRRSGDHPRGATPVSKRTSTRVVSDLTINHTPGSSKLRSTSSPSKASRTTSGASGWTTFRRIILPALYPALLGGAGLAFARAIGEFGSVVLIGGGIPRDTEVASQYIAKQIETDRPASAAAVSVTLLLISFVVLFAIRWITKRKDVS